MGTPSIAEMQGRCALVTGAGSGIGLATARCLLDHGAKVAAVVQDGAQEAITRAQLPQAHILVQDLRDDAGCAALPERAAAALGGQFTQADINSGGLRYYDYGLNLGQDDFDFSVSDGAGGLANGKFVIQPTVGTYSPENGIAFDLSPNPTSAHTTLSMGQTLAQDARATLHNTAGQLLGTWILSAGTHALRIDTQHLPAGVYVVSVEHENFKGVKKLVLR